MAAARVHLVCAGPPDEARVGTLHTVWCLCIAPTGTRRGVCARMRGGPASDHIRRCSARQRAARVCSGGNVNGGGTTLGITRGCHGTRDAQSLVAPGGMMMMMSEGGRRRVCLHALDGLFGSLAPLSAVPVALAVPRTCPSSPPLPSVPWHLLYVRNTRARQGG